MCSFQDQLNRRDEIPGFISVEGLVSIRSLSNDPAYLLPLISKIENRFNLTYSMRNLFRGNTSFLLPIYIYTTYLITIVEGII